MSNLGLYQWITTTSKKVGGPIQFLAIVGACGYGVVRAAEALVTSAVKHGVKQYNKLKETAAIYEVTEHGTVDAIGLCVKPGDKFRVLETDEEAILIELIDDSNNPYFVSAEFLNKVSNYEK